MTKKTTTYTALLGVAGLVAALLALVSVAGPTGADGPVYAPAGTLDLVANPTDGDAFVLVPEGATTPTATEGLISNNQSKLSEVGPDDLVQLSATGPAAGQLPYVGLKDHHIGVRAKGEGSGTPSSQVNDAGAEGQTLTIALGPDITAKAGSAQVAMKFKFGATARVEAFDGSTSVASTTATCEGSDCGADSGQDRIVVAVGDGTTLFDRIVISITAPSDGAVSVVDDPAAGFDTYFTLVKEYDGELACDDTTDTVSGDETEGTFTRLATDEVADGCDTLKLFDLEIFTSDPAGPQVRFVPDDPTVAAEYRGDLEFPTDPGNPIASEIEYDRDGPGPDGFVPMQWCEKRDGTNGDYEGGYPGGAYYPEYAGLGTGTSGPSADAFPTISGLGADSDGGPATSCIVAYSTTGDTENWVVHLVGDPFYR